MKRTKIEYRELSQLGVSDEGLDFYNMTDPLDVYDNNDGTYTIEGGYDERTFESAEELVEYFDYNGKTEAQINELDPAMTAASNLMR